MTFILTAILVVGGSWATYDAPGRNDQYQLIQLGQCVHHGGKMYVDCWENKPPGIAWLGALALLAGRGNPIGPWIVPGVLEFLALLILWLALRRIVGNRVARQAMLLSALVYALRLYDTPSINPDFYSSVLELAAIAILIRAAVPPLGGDVEQPDEGDEGRTYSYLLCVVAGLFWAAATTVKQVGCLGMMVFTVCGFLTAIFSPAIRGHVIKSTLATWLGFLVGAGAVAAVLWRQGVLLEARDAILTFNSGLLKTVDFLAVVNNRARLQSELAPLALPLWLGLVGVFLSFWYRRYRGFPLSLTIALVLWWVAAIVLADAGPSRSMRYWQATFPPMLALAAVGLFYIQHAQDRLESPSRMTVLIIALTAVLLLVVPASREVRDGFASSMAATSNHPTERASLIEIADRVRELTKPGERMYVLDYRPGIYVYSDRPAAVRFNYPRSAGQWQEIVSRLESGAARLILIPEKPSPEFRSWSQSDGGESTQKVLELERCEPSGAVGGYRFLVCDSQSDGG